MIIVVDKWLHSLKVTDLHLTFSLSMMIEHILDSIKLNEQIFREEMFVHVAEAFWRQNFHLEHPGH